jgi:DNA-binding NarL/FixJ family response regulator
MDRLTPRQIEALRLRCRGLSAAQIAERLGVSHNVVKYHLGEAYETLAVGSLGSKRAEPGAKDAWACYLLGLADSGRVLDPDGRAMRAWEV